MELVCPRFHQYPFDTEQDLRGFLACFPQADALIVSDTLRPESGQTAWNAYIADVRELVATGYDCVETTGSQVCVKQRL